jgi:hypothetical protein
MYNSSQRLAKEIRQKILAKRVKKKLRKNINRKQAIRNRESIIQFDDMITVLNQETK